MKISDIPLYFHTVRYLHFRQIFYRIKYMIRAKLPGRFWKNLNQISGEIDWAPLKSLAPFLTYTWWKREEISHGFFKFLNEEAEFGSDIDWKAAGKGRLWKYNLHYFQYLHIRDRLDAGIGFHLMQSWIKNNPPEIQDAWDPFPVSLRIVNWIKYLSSYKQPIDNCCDIIHSLYSQALYIEKSIEYHLLGNHLFKNAKALVFSGLFFEGLDAKRRLAKGSNLLAREIKEQILSDGGHFERSPMYHSMILEDCLDLLNICTPYQNQDVEGLCVQLEKKMPDMIRFLEAMTHPDGQIALFNDAAFGIEAPPEDLIDYYNRLVGKESEDIKTNALRFPESGYFIMAPEPENRLLIDCGQIGPDYQPGHSHCDTLSFELSLKKKRIIVDSGCFQYKDSSIRKINRGNMGHNTLTIDRQNQSEVWSAHRCGRRARPKYAHLEIEPDGTLFFEGAHNGYSRLPGNLAHYRSIRWSDHICLIHDRVEGRGVHHIESRLNIHPSLNVDFFDNEVVIRNGDEVLVSISMNGEGRIEENEGWYCPEFGVKNACVVLAASYKNVSLPFEGGWILTI